MLSTPKSVIAFGLTAFAASAGYLGHTVIEAAADHRRPAPLAQTYVAPQAPRTEVAELPARPGALMEFKRIEGKVHAVDTEERTVTLDNGFTYTIPQNLATPELHEGEPITLAVGTAMDQYTVFMFVAR